ncbi:MAG: DUF3619 family protein [Burkholderiaceae bacterium]|jgi:hypothetical protein|nr:DUF3619 family protein [Burkholderiaceae bacterium]
MTTSYNLHHIVSQQARYGLRVAARMSAGLDDFPHDISERLRVARQQAVARLHSAPVAPSYNYSASTPNSGDDRLGLWGWLASGAMAMVLVAGLVTINIMQEDDRTMDLADLDAVLLTDDLPPEAYADRGFLQYLKSDSARSVTQ